MPDGYDHAAILQGAAAIVRAVDCIGEEGVTDHDCAKVIVESELAIRKLILFAVIKISEELAEETDPS